jgi:hypothetical protein
MNFIIKTKFIDRKIKDLNKYYKKKKFIFL